jgi:Protein of unknown function (DUF2384)
MTPATLTKALLRAAEQLDLRADLSVLLRLSPDEVARIHSGEATLDTQSEAWGRALKVVSLFRTLVLLVGTTERARIWLISPNAALAACPIDLLRSQEDERVYRYLDAVHKHELRLPGHRDGESSSEGGT